MFEIIMIMGMMYLLLVWCRPNVRNVSKGERLMSMFTEDDEFYAYGKKLSIRHMIIIIVKIAIIAFIVFAICY